MKNFTKTSLIAALATLSFAATSQAAEIRVMCYQDNNECDVTADLAKRFEAANPGTKVVIDTVPYKTIQEQLPVQLGAGQGPDIVRTTDLGGLSKYYLDIAPYVKDTRYWEANFGTTLPWLRPTATDKGIYGFMNQLTMTGPYVNKTLFDQAKVAIPGPKATWDDWAEATRKVAAATKIPAGMAWDRTGHRFAGPAISFGAKIFDAKGDLVIDQGFKNAASKFVGWHKDGTMLKDVWVSAGGSAYANSVNEFLNGRVAMILSGSWSIGNLAKNADGKFDWIAVPNPCGGSAAPQVCSGVPGGAAWAGIKTTKSPKEVGMFLDFLAQEANYAEFVGKTNNIPAHTGVARKGVNYTSATPSAKAALAVFGNGVGNIALEAFMFQGYKYNRAMMLPTVSRVTQAIVGELSLDDAMARLSTDMADAVKAASK